MIRTPAEFEAASALMLTWPHFGQDWDEAALPLAQASLLELARVVARTGAGTGDAPRIMIAADPRVDADALRQRLIDAGAAAGQISLHAVASNDIWARDHGPISVMRGDALELVDFRFNGWGGKYPADLDDAITAQLYAEDAFPAASYQAADVVVEGGALEFDGRGGLLVNQRCVVDSKRNLSLDARAFEALMAQHCGVSQVHWLDTPPLAGDDTDGHIDTLARFVSPDVVVYQGCADSLDAHHAPLQDMAAQLAKLGRGRWDTLALPLPAALHDDGRRLPAGYANFLMFNDLVAVPVYKDKADDLALRRIESACPGKTIWPIDCRALVSQNGSLHCATMQIAACPAPTASSH